MSRPVNVWRDVQDFPTEIPGSVRILANVVAPADDAVKDQLAAEVARRGGLEVWRSEVTDAIQVDLPVEQLAFLDETPLLARYAFNVYGRPTLAQSVPLIGVSGSFGPFYWPGSWGSYYVAVLDTGVLDGGVLAGRVAHGLGACFSSSNSSYESLCPGGATEAYGVGAAVPCPYAGCLHGSHVAATVASAQSPSFGVVAASPVQVAPVQIFSARRFDHALFVFRSDVQRALDYLLQFGLVGFRISAINMSFSFFAQFSTTPCDTGPLYSSLNTLNNFRIAPIAAAGNIFSTNPADGTNSTNVAMISSPACYSPVVAVGATTDFNDSVAVNVSFLFNGTTYYFSSTGNALIDFWAPGARIRTPVETAEQYGTSFSSPHVAGVWTRLRGRYPGQSNAWIKSQLATCPQRADPRTGLSRPRICWKSIWQ